MKKKKIIKKEKIAKVIEEFKKFIARGNVIDLAVGVIVGGAFGKIVTSLVNDILMPIIGMFLGGLDFTGLKLTFRNAEILYGSFIQNVIDFIIVALCIFVLVKVVNRLSKGKEEEKKKEEKTEPAKKPDDILLLEEIRDLLKEKNRKK